MPKSEIEKLLDRKDTRIKRLEQTIVEAGRVIQKGQALSEAARAIPTAGYAANCALDDARRAFDDEVSKAKGEQEKAE